ncbi:hypothetical protein BaRGS_00000196 [Batillaria attramentaria]|uniref:Protein FAM184A/B N-terminal domain-containing protein n=1 Tax=Batillaria attramentaria TaxID=370345 RepID=A0ABD0MAI8_9CAEN
MATGKMSFNYYQNGKYGSLPHNPQKDMEVTQDMHLKMSKKIAQLTKVIYALNTKNDENEAVLQGLRDQHEEEKQQLLGEMQAKIQLYKSRLEGETDHRRQISILQTRISDYETQNASVEERFARLKEETSLREQRLQQEHNQQIQQLTQDVLRAKREFEEHLQGFEAWKAQSEAEHTAAMQDAEIRHAKELDEIRGFQRNQDTEWLNQCAEIEDRFKGEILSLQDRLAAEHAQRLKMEEEFSQKLEKAQAFYEKELQALQQNRAANFEGELSALRDQQEKLKNDFAAQEKELRKQIDRLVRQLADAEDAAEAHKQAEERLMKELGSKDSSTLEAAHQETAAALARLRDVETELSASKERCSDQAQDLLQKSALIGELEANKMQKAAQVEELTNKLNDLHQRLAQLTAERASLESQQHSLSTEQQSQLASLRQMIQDLTVEKETMRQKYEREVQSLKQLMEEKVKDVTSMLEGKLAASEKQHAEERDRDRKAAADVLLQTKQDMQSKFDEEQNKLKAEKDSIQAEFDRVKADLLARCKQAEEEVDRLTKMVRESEQGLGSASSHINSLKEAAASLKSELDKTRTELKTTKTTSANLKAELDKLQLLHNSKMAEWQLELKSRLEKLAAELDTKWTDTMKAECTKLKQELTAQKDDEKRAALEHLTQLKDEEIAALRASFETKVTHLSRQVDDLRAKLDKAHAASSEEQEYALKIQHMEKMHEDTMETTIKQKDLEKEELEKKLKASHMEDLKAQMAAHKATLHTAQEVAEQTLKMQLKEAEEKFRSEQDKLRTELQEKLETEVENLRKSHGSELRSARMELERAVEISKQKERDHQLRAEELQEEISQRETHIVKLKEEVKRLQAAINSLNRAIADKDKDTQRVRGELKEQFRQLEERLRHDHKRAIENLSADQAREQQELLTQFNQAQDILKDKISELQIMLSDAEERYNQRDSRPEDLELIQQLRMEVQEREMRVKQLIDEKRFYQLELVNRETNFNKVFNTTPNVGVLNPLTASKPKKKGEKVPLKHASAPSLNAHIPAQRLDPLPNSPIHDGNLNPTKPLPQPGGFTKKFVK